MANLTETAPQTPNETRPETSPRPSFITPEMIAKNPVLEVAGMFAGDPLFDEVVEEIKKERERQKRRDRKAAK